MKRKWNFRLLLARVWLLHGREAAMGGGRCQQSFAAYGCAARGVWVSFVTLLQSNYTAVHLPGAALLPPWDVVSKKLCPKSHLGLLESKSKICPKSNPWACSHCAQAMEGGVVLLLQCVLVSAVNWKGFMDATIKTMAVFNVVG